MGDRLTEHIAARRAAGLDGGVWEAINQRFLELGSIVASQAASISELDNTAKTVSLDVEARLQSAIFQMRQHQSDAAVGRVRSVDLLREKTPTLEELLADIRDDIRTLCILQQQANAKQKRRR
jgi:hypothetical protein